MRFALLGSTLGALCNAVFGTGSSSSVTSRRHSVAGGGAAAQCALTPLPPLPSAIDPKEFRPFALVNTYDESPDTKVLRFAFPDGLQQASLKLTSFVLLRFKDAEGRDVVRPYTPISRLDQRGYMEILIKCYKGSKMGTHLHNMKLGQTIEIKGPYEKLPYAQGMYKKIGMIAGGTGITPMFQICREALKENNGPEISLIYCNKRKEDVLLGSELSELYELHQHFAPYFVLEDPPRDWMGGVGHVTTDMIKAFMPPPTRAFDCVICVCGPPGFMKHVSGDKDFTQSPPTQGELGGLLKEMGYPQRMIYKF